MPRLVLAFTLLGACNSDPASTDASATDELDPDRTVSLDPPENGYQVVTEPIEVPPHTEVEMCTVVRLDPDDQETLAWVGHMESMSSPGTHHMNVFIGQFSFLDAFLGEGAFGGRPGQRARHLPVQRARHDGAGLPRLPQPAGEPAHHPARGRGRPAAVAAGGGLQPPLPQLRGRPGHHQRSAQPQHHAGRGDRARRQHRLRPPSVPSSWSPRPRARWPAPVSSTARSTSPWSAPTPTSGPTARP